MFINNSLLEIADKYSCFLLDIWGVIHASGVLYPNVLEVTKTLMESGKKIVLLSNAPRRAVKVQKFLEVMGVFKGMHYHDILTSGEVFFRLLEPGSKSKIFYLGPERDLDIFLEAPDIELTTNLGDNFEFAVITGVIGGYEDVLKNLLAKNITIFCVNPDLIVAKSNAEIEKCAGFVAEEYEKIGGKVIYYGKPYPQVFMAAMGLLSGLTGGNMAKSDVIMVGDGMETDIKGAANFGIDSCLCLSGLPSLKLSAGVSLQDFLSDFSPIKPTFAIKSL